MILQVAQWLETTGVFSYTYAVRSYTVPCYSFVYIWLSFCSLGG